MAGALPRILATTAASVAIFAVSLAVLFMRSEKVFTRILTVHNNEFAKMEAHERTQFVYWSFRTSEINKMIRDLADQREALQARIDAVAAQEAQIQSERKENQRLRDEITRARKELSDYIIEVKAGEARRIREEVAIINNMEPATVVTLFNQKSDDDVVKVLGLMKADAVGPILELMLAQPAGSDPTATTPEKRVANILEKLKRLRVDAAPR